MEIQGKSRKGKEVKEEEIFNYIVIYGNILMKVGNFQQVWGWWINILMMRNLIRSYTGGKFRQLGDIELWEIISIRGVNERKARPGR